MVTRFIRAYRYMMKNHPDKPGGLSFVVEYALWGKRGDDIAQSMRGRTWPA